MRRDEQQKQAKEMAKKAIKDINDYETIENAIAKETFVILTYVKNDHRYRYRKVYPKGWIYTGTSYLWAFHEIHNKKHSFKAEKISNVTIATDIVTAITNPPKYPEFWDGSQYRKETTLEE